MNSQEHTGMLGVEVSRSAVTSTMSCWVAETGQRSSTWRSATAGAEPVGVSRCPA